MKKLTVIFAILMLATTIKLNAQGTVKIPTQPTAKGITKLGSRLLMLTGTMKEGMNSMLVKEGKGTLQFVKKGDSYADVIFTDENGKVIRLMPATGGTNGAPTPECKTKLPDACFGSADKNIGMCICKPDNISNGVDQGYTVKFYRELLLREAN